MTTDSFYQCLSAQQLHPVEVERYSGRSFSTWEEITAGCYFCGEYIWRLSDEEEEVLDGTAKERAILGAARLRNEQLSRLRLQGTLVGPQQLREIPPEVRAYVLERDDYRCQQCGAAGPLHVDHIIPVALGGESTPSNLHVLCAECNLAKGDSV